ncbi:MAG: NAD(P)H-dependent glycerol-3-phosphate dehydrogenase [Cytophagales bacterium]
MAQNGQNITEVAVIGSGSWATAIVKILSENKSIRIKWWFRSKDTVKLVKKLRINPNHLSDVKINNRKVKASSKIAKVVGDAKFVVLAVPSAFIKDALIQLDPNALKDKVVISAIKGMIPDENLLVSEFIEKEFGVPINNQLVIAGPCHAEEVALEKMSYLTIAGPDENIAGSFAQLMNCRYVSTHILGDIKGVEYSAVMKNIIALACGIANGQNFGDNFQAVLVSNAVQEIHRFLHAIDPRDRFLDSSAYLGDILVTAYSQFSRNRMLGNMVGRGYSVRSAMVEMSMVAEGYYAVKSIHEVNKKYQVDLPIINGVYHILYDRVSPMIEFEILKGVLK